MPTNVITKLVQKDFFWDVRVIHASSTGEKNRVMFALTLNTIDENGQDSKIMLEMNLQDLDRCIQQLKRKDA